MILRVCSILDFKILNPKLVICGINPHAGENGILGNEEKQFLQPVLKKLIFNNINIHGPLSADTIFNTENRKCNKCDKISHLSNEYPKIVDNFEQIFSLLVNILIHLFYL